MQLWKIKNKKEIFYLLIKNGMGYDFGLAICNKNQQISYPKKK